MKTTTNINTSTLIAIPNFREKKSSYFQFSIAALLIMLIFSSCQSKLTEAELKEYIKNPKNGLLQQKKVNNVEFSVNYKPTALLLTQELSRDSQSEDKIKVIQQKYEKYLYFNVSISQNNKEILSNTIANNSTYQTTLSELLTNMNQHVYLLNDKNDTLKMIDYVYPRVYGHSSSTNIMFVFSKEHWDNTEFIKLYINEFGLNTGNTKYKFTKKDIKNTPELIEKT